MAVSSAISKVSGLLTRFGAFRRGGIAMVGAWDVVRSAFQKGRLKSEINVMAQDIFADTMERVRRQIQHAILSGSARPGNAPATVLLKGRDSPWTNTGLLAMSVKVFKIRAFTWAVGFRENVAAHGAMDVAAIALMNEFGATIRVTPAMRGWFAARGIFLNPSTRAIVIPARPLVGPIVQANQGLLAKSFLDVRAKQMADRLTRPLR